MSQAGSLEYTRKKLIEIESRYVASVGWGCIQGEGLYVGRWSEGWAWH